MVQIGILVFPEIEELDFIGPFEVLSYINKIKPNSTNILLVTPDEKMIKGFNGLRFFADYSIENCPHLDVLVIPGGQGRKTVMKNDEIINFIKIRYEKLVYLSSVCTGSLIIGATGLLRNKSATTYHTALDELRQMGASVKTSKVVQDGKIITGAGVSSGIDVGLYLLSKLFNDEIAEEVARKIEYSWKK